jgi:hypothetical protein
MASILGSLISIVPPGKSVGGKVHEALRMRRRASLPALASTDLGQTLELSSLAKDGFVSHPAQVDVECEPSIASSRSRRLTGGCGLKDPMQGIERQLYPVFEKSSLNSTQAASFRSHLLCTSDAVLLLRIHGEVPIRGH